MISSFSARRRADDFQELIERAFAAEHPTLEHTRYADLAPALAALREAPPVMPRADFSADLRSRLMAAAGAALAPDTAAQLAARRPAPTRSARDRKVAAVLGGFAIVAASTSMAVAAQTALPGDTLYPLKRAIENAHADVQSGDGKGATLLANANSRLKEVDALSRTGSDDPQVIARTLQDFTDQATQASTVLLSDYRSTGHLSTLQQLRSFTADSMVVLDQLRTEVPTEVRATLIQATQVLRQIDQQALAACPGCTVESMAPALTSAHVPEILSHLVDVAGRTRPAATQHQPTGKHPGKQSAPSAAPSTGPDTSTPSIPVASGPPKHTGTTKPPGTTDPGPIRQVTKHLHDVTASTHGLQDLLGGADQVVTGLGLGGP